MIAETKKDAEQRMQRAVEALKEELKRMRELTVETADTVLKEQGAQVEYTVGTMIELPRACVIADGIAALVSGGQASPVTPVAYLLVTGAVAWFGAGRLERLAPGVCD